MVAVSLECYFFLSGVDHVLRLQSQPANMGKSSG